MSAILQLIEAANAEAERLRHLAQNTEHTASTRLFEHEAVRWARLAAAAAIELAIIRPQP